MNAAAEKESPRRAAPFAGRRGPQAAKFAGVGLLNTGLDFLIFLALQAAGVLALAANLAAFLCANGASYALNARLTFGERMALAGYGRFLSVHIASLAISTAFIAAFADLIGALAAKAAAAAVAFVWNYAGSALFVFRKSGAKS